jgi:hypothetical protein
VREPDREGVQVLVAELVREGVLDRVEEAVTEAVTDIVGEAVQELLREGVGLGVLLLLWKGFRVAEPLGVPEGREAAEKPAELAETVAEGLLVALLLVEVGDAKLQFTAPELLLKPGGQGRGWREERGQ